MRVHTVGLLLSSPILSAGMHGLLHKAHGLTITDIAESVAPEEYASRIETIRPAVMIVDPFTAKYCPKDTVSILLIADQVPENVRDRHALTITIYDDPGSIVNKIKLLANPIQNNDDKSNELSPREKEVILGIVKGLSNKEIASDMNVSVNTVMTHRRNISSKLQIHSSAGLTIYAIATGLIRIEDVAI